MDRRLKKSISMNGRASLEKKIMYGLSAMQVAPASAARRPTVHSPSRNVSGIAAVPVISEISRIDWTGLPRSPLVAQASMK